MTAERVVVVGAGAVGGVLAAGLARAGTDVAVVARGRHGEAIAADGLVVESPLGSDTVRLPVAPDVGAVSWLSTDLVVLAVKSHHTPGVLADLAGVWSRPLPVVCVQNGIANEPTARRWTPDVYGACVMLPASHLQPGVVHAHWAPTTGMLDVGRFPGGVDDRSVALAATLEAASFSSHARPDIMRWKNAKLVMNLGNAAEALCGRSARGGRLAGLLEREGRACLAAAGLDAATVEELTERRAAMRPVTADDADAAGSTWQSLARRRGVESAYLNGEVVLLGDRHGVATPANALVLDRVLTAAAQGRRPGAVHEDDLLVALDAMGGTAGRLGPTPATATRSPDHVETPTP